MNIFAFELRRLARSLITDCIVMAAIAAALLIACFPVYHDAQSQVESVLSSYPPDFLTAFGVSGDIFSFGGFFEFSYLYLAFAAAIMASAWGLATFGRESRARCDDFLFSLPKGRGCIFVAKLGACVVCVAVLGVVTVATCVGSNALAGTDGIEPVRIARAAAGIAGVQVVFLAIGAALGCCLRRVRSISGIATGLGIIGFMLFSLPALLDEEKLEYLSPLSWFNPQPVLDGGTLTSGHLAVAAGVSAVLLVLAAARTMSRDARGA